jgi:thiosulfate/3-mercaptopyruvate sulfurtransferase
MHELIIDAQDFRAETKPTWVVIDCRFRLEDPHWGEQAFRQEHIPGACYLNLDTQLSGRKSGRNGRHPLPDRQTLAATFNAIGIKPDTQVITYDDAGGMYAARARWLLRWLGHRNVAVLDGGITAYLQAGGTLTTQPASSGAGAFAPGASLVEMVELPEVINNLHTPHFTVVDARAADRFHGKNETLDPVGGHIPGALNRFFRDNLDTAGCFKPAAQLRQDWQALIGPDINPGLIVHQCGSGVTACVNQLAMEIAGLEGSSLYPGSWSEWCAAADRPVSCD